MTWQMQSACLALALVLLSAQVQGACRSCDQSVTGRNLGVARAVQVVQDEEYLSAADKNLIKRKKRHIPFQTPASTQLLTRALLPEFFSFGLLRPAQPVAQVAVPQPSTNYVTQPVQNAIVQSFPQPLFQSAAQPVAQPFLRAPVQPLVHSAYQSVAQAVQPVAQPLTHSAFQSVAQPVAQPLANSVAQPVQNTLLQSFPQSSFHLGAQPAAQPFLRAPAQPLTHSAFQSAFSAPHTSFPGVPTADLLNITFVAREPVPRDSADLDAFRALSLVPADGEAVAIFPPFATPRTVPAVAVIFRERSQALKRQRRPTYGPNSVTVFYEEGELYGLRVSFNVEEENCELGVTCDAAGNKIDDAGDASQQENSSGNFGASGQPGKKGFAYGDLSSQSYFKHFRALSRFRRQTGESFQSDGAPACRVTGGSC